jgi:hypothetical protein
MEGVKTPPNVPRPLALSDLILLLVLVDTEVGSR